MIAFTENLFNNYLQPGEVTPGVQGNHHHGEIIADVATSFVILAGIYFPSVTGTNTFPLTSHLLNTYIIFK